MKKQVFSVLLTLCMASSTMPVTVFGAEEGSVAVKAEVSQQDDSAKDAKEAGSSESKVETPAGDTAKEDTTKEDTTKEDITKEDSVSGAEEDTPKEEKVTEEKSKEETPEDETKKEEAPESDNTQPDTAPSVCRFLLSSDNGNDPWYKILCSHPVPVTSSLPHLFPCINAHGIKKHLY